MTKTFTVDSEVWLAIASRYRCVKGVDVPAGIDLCKIYVWYEISEMQHHDTWEEYNAAYGDEASYTELEFSFFKKMFNDGVLKATTADTPEYVDGYVTQGSIEGSGFIIVCPLPLIFDTAF